MGNSLTLAVDHIKFVRFEFMTVRAENVETAIFDLLDQSICIRKSQQDSERGILLSFIRMVEFACI